MIVGVFRGLKSLIVTIAALTWSVLAVALIALLAYAFLAMRDVPRLPDSPFGLQVTLSGRLVDALPASDWLSPWEAGGDTALIDVLEALHEAAEDAAVKAVRLDVSELTEAGPASVVDLQRALAKVRAAGKPVTVYADFYTQTQWMAAAGAGERLIHPMGAVEIKGLSSERLYWGEALRRWGLTPDIVKAGDYKTAPEAFERASPSAEALFADERWMKPLWARLVSETESVAGLKSGALRGYAVALRELDAVAPADVALKRGLVTGFANQETAHAKEAVKRWVGVEQYLSSKREGASEPSEQKPFVAVLFAEGEIASGGTAGIDADELVERIREVEKATNAKALLMRLNSPGGDAFAADRIYHALESVRAAGKPIVVSMGDMAASGGYWVSLAADKIVASPLSVTGSIGAFSVTPKLDGFLAKWGVGYAGYATPEHVLSASPFAPTSEPARRLERALLSGVYGRFCALVAKRRGLDPVRVEEVAGGAVWTGEQAHTLGLVDVLGDFDDALELAKRLAGGNVDEALVYLPPERVRWQSLARSWLGAAVRALGVETAAGTGMNVRLDTAPLL